MGCTRRHPHKMLLLSALNEAGVRLLNPNLPKPCLGDTHSMSVCIVRGQILMQKTMHPQALKVICDCHFIHYTPCASCTGLEWQAAYQLRRDASDMIYLSQTGCSWSSPGQRVCTTWAHFAITVSESDCAAFSTLASCACQT